MVADGHGGSPLAERLLSVALEAGDLIARKHLRGHRRLDLLPDPYRFWSLWLSPYLVVYNVASRPPYVLQMLHIARNLPTLLEDLEHDGDAARVWHPCHLPATMAPLRAFVHDRCVRRAVAFRACGRRARSGHRNEARVSPHAGTIRPNLGYRTGAVSASRA